MRGFAPNGNQHQQKVSAKTAKSKAVTPEVNKLDHPILDLQRLIGNQAVVQLLAALPEGLGAGAGTSTKPGSGPDISQAPGSEKKSPATAQPSVAGVAAHDGQSLDPAIRNRMEAHFGHDFSQVRVHADEASARAAEHWNAHACTVANHIHFGVPYEPSSPAGQALLAH